MNSRAKKRPSIARMFSVYLILSLLLISGIAFLGSYTFSVNKSRAELQVKVDDKFKDLKEILKRPMWNFNDREVQIIGHLYMKHEYIDALTIKNNDGVIVFSEGGVLKHPLFSRESEINYHDAVVGHIYYSVSGRFLDEIQSTYIWSFFINIVSIMLTTFFIVGFFLRSVLEKAFTSFIDGVDEFSKGDEMAFDKESSYSEFDPLVSALRKMAHERSQADALRQDAVELKEKIVTASPVGIAVYDGTGQCITANESFATIIGASKEQALQQNYHQIESWKKSDIYERATKAVEEQTVLYLEVQLTTSFGKAVYLDCQFVPIVIGDDNNLMLMINDITERRRVEKALLDSELWLKSIFNSLDEAVLVVSPDRELMNVNDAAQRMFGYSVEEIFNNSTELFHVDHQHFVEFGEHISKAFSAGDIADFEFEAKRKNGEIFPTEHTVTLLKNAEGEQVGIVSVVRDISVRKQNEAELVKHRDHLEVLVLEGNKEIIVAKEDAERANAAKSDFMSRMSHELRTPMNAILGFGQLLEMNSEGMSEVQHGQIKEILDAGAHLLTLINEVLDLAKIESGKLDYFMEKVCVKDILLESISLIKPLAEARNIKLIDKTKDDNYNVDADATRLKQIFLNLLSNAVKYNCENGSITIENKIVEDQRLRISVTDTGEGLSEADLSNLYNPFERLNIQENVEGTGIGLTITKHLVELMGGTIGVDSKLGEGSTFWIELKLM